jgi:RHS repeat-associated protein
MGSMVAYTYLGLGMVVQQADGNGVTLSYITGTGASRYGGLDRFGRVTGQDWTDGATTIEDLVYGYDADSNVTTRTDDTSSYSANNSESYTYDGLNRLTGFLRGNISTGTITSSAASQSWSLDAVGNWNSDTTGSTAVSRVNNAKNEVASVGGTSLGYDNDGNALSDGTGETFTYDAWNRLVGIANVVNGSGTTTETLTYMANLSPATESFETVHGRTMAFVSIGLYESATNQVSEQDVGIPEVSVFVGGGPGDPEGYDPGGTSFVTQYVWGLAYVNDLVERDDSGSSSDLSYGMAGSGLNERLYAVRDANHDVVALTDVSGNVLERLDYSPYGTQTVLNSDFAPATDAYKWDVGFQGGVQIGVPVGVMTGLIQFDNRVYDAALGRWLQPDPAGYVDGASRSDFTASNPVNRLDPGGLETNFKTPTPPKPLYPASGPQWPGAMPGFSPFVTVGVGTINIPSKNVTAPDVIIIRAQPNSLFGSVANCHWIQFASVSGIDTTNKPLQGFELPTNLGYFFADGSWFVDTDNVGTMSSAFYGSGANVANENWSQAEIGDRPDYPDIDHLFKNGVKILTFSFIDILVCCGKPKYTVSWNRTLTYNQTTNSYDKEYHVDPVGTGPSKPLPGFAKSDMLPFSPKHLANGVFTPVPSIGIPNPIYRPFRN